MTYRFAFLLALLACPLVAEQALAQGQFQANNRQPIGGFGATGVATGQFGNAQLGNPQFGAGSPGAFGQQQFGQQGQPGAFGPGGQPPPPPGSAEAMRNAFENMSGRERRRATFDFVVESLNEMREQRRERRRRRRRPDPVRIQIRPALTVAPVDATTVTADLNDSLARSIELEGSSALAQVTVEAGRATLTGTVADERERAVLARMLSIQPGVSEVDNRLVVQAIELEAPSLPEPPPPAATTSP